MEINIENYLSEEEIKDIVIEEYKELIRKGLLLQKDTKKNTENYERILYNAVYHYLEKEIDSIIGIDHKKLINDKVKKNLNDGLKYSIFRFKNAWEKENSPATDYMNKCINENLHLIENKVKQKMSELPESYFEEIVNDLVYNVIKDRIIGKE